ncbi:MAG: hypothetical protein JO149_01560 [Gammaproteobacteria bacterium]|nr:hypothetical protein [Gammaproteobacteria bacterium]
MTSSRKEAVKPVQMKKIKNPSEGLQAMVHSYERGGSFVDSSLHKYVTHFTKRNLALLYEAYSRYPEGDYIWDKANINSPGEQIFTLRELLEMKEKTEATFKLRGTSQQIKIQLPEMIVMKCKSGRQDTFRLANTATNQVMSYSFKIGNSSYLITTPIFDAIKYLQEIQAKKQPPLQIIIDATEDNVVPAGQQTNSPPKMLKKESEPTIQAPVIDFTEYNFENVFSETLFNEAVNFENVIDETLLNDALNFDNPKSISPEFSYTPASVLNDNETTNQVPARSIEERYNISGIDNDSNGLPYYVGGPSRFFVRKNQNLYFASDPARFHFSMLDEEEWAQLEKRQEADKEWKKRKLAQQEIERNNGDIRFFARPNSEYPQQKKQNTHTTTNSSYRPRRSL